MFHIVINEGASTCIMSISCWRVLSSPSLMTSSTILKEFDGHTFHPHWIISRFPTNLGGKTIFIKVKVVDASIDYNFLLGRPSFYDMKLVASFVFHVVCFPHKGKIVTINQLDY